jgi:hypothetical protein
VFSVGFDTELDGEKYEKDYDFDVSLSARKVTETWKFTSYFRYDYSANQYEHDDETIKDTRKNMRANGRLAKKLSSHWAVGLKGNADSDVRRNNKLTASISPEIECNLYPYSEFSRKQFPIRLGFSLNHHDYNKETIYGKTSEWVGRTYLSASSVIQGKWGNIINVLEGSFYLHDFKKNNFEWVNIFSFRLFKGFSTHALFVVNLIHDQLYLEKGDRSVEEVLLRRKELETSYNYYISFGFSYSFGSMYQNIVNPRFGY